MPDLLSKWLFFQRESSEVGGPNFYAAKKAFFSDAEEEEEEGESTDSFKPFGKRI